ncbi:Transcriptional regulator, xre family [Pediococcus pentosaceus ATCC 25745]|uniref:Transcriptional regulator, xre family n=1 Tax=Pediococcus pentosaceus (strain ATCC 25745 / CCUG 21536 / LMG 10740 / 183-1w) TaxID=278197 RepID=Q03G63_PEDPA|nr:helix-turn-helix transcriptional regulator [Pediococcus pentosaceus]ABJ67809.1 Transcriptional regulator, xre family [Pediococcus pentosaceus ATCC 25745]
MTLVERIKEVAKNKKGWNLKTTAEKAGLGINSIYRWRTQTPQTDKLASVAKVLGVSVDYLLGETEKEEPVSDTRDMEVEEALNSVRMYQGKPISDAQRETMKGIIRAYLDAQDKNE